MDQYKENENNLTNENDGRESVIPEPEFEEVKATTLSRYGIPTTSLFVVLRKPMWVYLTDWY